jgi:hypothetical protein
MKARGLLRLAVIVLALAALNVTALNVRSAHAYSIASGFTHSCHERMTVPALVYFLQGVQSGEAVYPPDDDLWRAATDDLVELMDSDPELQALLQDEGLRFAAASLFIGLREPDTNGYSVTDLDALRSVHGDPSAEGQYAHALRASDDVGPTGDLSAIAGTRTYVEERLGEVGELFSASGSAQIVTTNLYVEHYGRIEIPVWGPAHRLGLALHTLQDSFSHSIRSEDGVRIRHVLNYVDAFSGELDETTGGLAHSTGMDDCDAEHNGELVNAAMNRSIAMVLAALKLREGDEGQAVSAGLNECQEEDEGLMECGWFSYDRDCQEQVEEQGTLEGTCCSRETDFCDAAHLQTVLDTPTKRVLEDSFGCSLAQESTGYGPTGQRTGVLGVLVILLLLLGARRALPLVALLGFLLLPTSAHAQENYPESAVLRLEGHASFLTDAVERSMLDVSYGPALKGGYRARGNEWGQWGGFAMIERDAWLATEYDSRLDPGVLNAAIGVEYLYYGYFRSAVSVGPSILLFDTGLHQPGSVGLFAEIQPIGMQLQFKHRWSLTFDPLGVAWVNPTPEWGNGPSVGHLQYRTSVGIEWRAVPHKRCRPRKKRNCK